MPPIWTSDRSRYQSGMNCARKRFWGYHFNRADRLELGGPGLEPFKRSAPLATGSAIHAGLARLLEGAGLKEAVADALKSYDQELAGRQLDLQEGEDAVWVAREQRMLTMAMVMAYERAALPGLLEEYEVLEVEGEESWRPAPDSWMVFMARLDALLLQKATGDFVVQSFKSAASWGKQQDDQNRHDFQGISEGMACEARLREGWKRTHLGQSYDSGTPRLEHVLAELPDPPKVMGIRMEFLLKGRRTEWPEGSGRWISPSPLIYGYRLKNPVGAQRFAWRQNWTDADGKGHRLDYRTWERFAVWEEVEFGPNPEARVQHWIQMLGEGLQAEEGAGDALGSQFVLPEVYFRDGAQSESWRRQMLAEEVRVAQRPFAVSGGGLGGFVQMLDESWPMNRSRCDDYGRPCEFASLCHGGVEQMRDPIGSGDFKWREPNHPQESDLSGSTAANGGTK